MNLINYNKLKGAMVQAGYTQLSFAKQLNMSKNTLNAKMNGKSKIYIDEANVMCEVLGIVDEKEKCDIFLS